jgi:hypothetical protein
MNRKLIAVLFFIVAVVSIYEIVNSYIEFRQAEEGVRVAQANYDKALLEEQQAQQRLGDLIARD